MKFLRSNFLIIFSVFTLSRFIIYFFGTMSNYNFGKKESIINSFCRWDCSWYSDLIKNGYDIAPHAHADGNAANWAFFPVFPKVISLLNTIFPFTILEISFFVNNLIFFVALCLLYKYVKTSLSESIAVSTVMLMSFSPYSLYFSVPYTESFFFLFLILVFYFTNKEQWIYAGIAAGLLSGTRVVGVMIVFPMLAMAIKQIGFKNLIQLKTESAYKAILAILVAPLGLFTFMYFLYLKTGDALAFSHIQRAWERFPHNPLTVLFEGLVKVNTIDFYFATVSLLGIILVFFLLWKKRYAEFIFSLLAIMIPLSTALYAMPRYTFTLFPIYIALAMLLDKRPAIKTFVLLFFSASLSFMATAWIIGKSFTI